MSFWTADEEKLALSSTAPTTTSGVSHHIRIIDASGSMCGDLEALKQQLEKEMTLDEYKRSDLHVSLISYASNGDCKLHFEHAPITEIMKANSSMIKVLRSISTRGCTGISQSLRMALGLVRKGELTGISLHSDGYANDPSPSQEYAAIDGLCKELAQANVFVNTVAYRESSDFKFLSKVANAVSGKCVLARSVKEVYDAIYDTSAVLNKAAVPVAVYEPKGADFVVLVSPTAKRINGSSDALKVSGLTKTDTGSVYRYKKVTEAEWNKSSAYSLQAGEGCLYAFAAAQLALGNLNTAKYAMVSTFDEELAKAHAKALTNDQIAAMAKDLTASAFFPKPNSTWTPLNFSGSTSVLKVLQVLDAHREDIEIDIEHLQSVYKRRGIKRVNGVRDDSGRLTAPEFEAETDKASWIPLGSFDINRNSASVNLTLARPCKLIKTADRSVISEVAGVKLNKLSTFNAYTIVGDGALNVSALKLNIRCIGAYTALSDLGVAPKIEGSWSSNSAAGVIIDLSSLPIMDYGFDKDISGIGPAFDQIVKAQVLSKILSAAAKEESDNLTKEQIEALKKHCLSKSLNLNFPTTTEYTDLQKALADGTVDIRTSYRVDVGNQELLGTSAIPSANAFLDRMYEQVEKGSGKVADKATFGAFFDRGTTYRFTGLSKKSKPAATDAILQPVFDDFLGVKANGSVNDILKAAGSQDTLASMLKDGAAGVIRNKKLVDEYVNDLYLANIVPLVFYIGATGLVPDQIEAPAQSVDKIQAKYPGLKLDKDAKEGLFFEIGKNLLLAVYAENAYYSVDKTAQPSIPAHQASKVATPASAPLRKRSALAQV